MSMFVRVCHSKTTWVIASIWQINWHIIYVHFDAQDAIFKWAALIHLVQRTQVFHQAVGVAENPDEDVRKETEDGCVAVDVGGGSSPLQVCAIGCVVCASRMHSHESLRCGYVVSYMVRGGFVEVCVHCQCD